MVTKGASNGIPSLHARKRRNMVKEMKDQLLESPNKPVDDEESDKSDENSEGSDLEQETRDQGFRTSPLVNNFMEPGQGTGSGATNNYMSENRCVKFGIVFLCTVFSFVGLSEPHF